MTVFLDEERPDFFITLIRKEGRERLFPISEVDHNFSNTAR